MASFSWYSFVAALAMSLGVIVWLALLAVPLFWLELPFVWGLVYAMTYGVISFAVFIGFVEGD